MRPSPSCLCGLPRGTVGGQRSEELRFALLLISRDRTFAGSDKIGGWGAGLALSCCHVIPRKGRKRLGRFAREPIVEAWRHFDPIRFHGQEDAADHRCRV